MMTKDTYVELVTALQEREEAWATFMEAAERFGLWIDYDPTAKTFEELTLRAIEAGVGDTEGWTTYFLYERYGDLSVPCVYDKDDNVIDTSSWEKVYELITERDVKLDV